MKLLYKIAAGFLLGSFIAVIFNLSGAGERTPTADDFVVAKHYCAARGLSPVGIERPLRGVTVGIACAQPDGRGWYAIPASVFESKGK